MTSYQKGQYSQAWFFAESTLVDVWSMNGFATVRLSLR